LIPQKLSGENENYFIGFGRDSPKWVNGGRGRLEGVLSRMYGNGRIKTLRREEKKKVKVSGVAQDIQSSAKGRACKRGGKEGLFVFGAGLRGVGIQILKKKGRE